jgi:hypothetical protein
MATPPNVTVAITAQDQGVSAAIKQLTAELVTLKQTQYEVAASAETAAASETKFAGSVQEARGAAKLFSEEAGVPLNRHLAGVLAKSELLGPILAKAFPIAAALGFAEVLVHVTEKVVELISDYFIYTEEQKKAYAELVAGNQELLKQETSLIDARKAGALQAVQGSQRILEQIRQLDVAQKGARPGDIEFLSGVVSGAQVKQLAYLQQRANLQALYNKDLEKEAAASAAARATAQEQAAQHFLALQRIQMSTAEALNEQAYTRGAESLAQYFKKRTDLIDQQADAEVVALEKSRAAAAAALAQVLAGPAGPEREPKEIAARQKVADIDARIAEVNATRTKEQKAADEDLFKKSEENAKKILEFREKDLELQGRSAEAGRNRMLQEKEIYEQALKATGASQEQIDAEIASWEKRKTLAADFAETQRRIQTELSVFDEQRKTAQETRTEQGPFSAEAANQVRIMTQEVAALEVELRKLQSEAIPGNEAQAREIANVTKKIQEEKAALDKLDLGNKLKTDLAGAFSKDLMSFFTTGITGARNFQDALQGLAASLIQSVQQMIAQLLELQIQSAFLKMLGVGGKGGGGGGGGFDLASIGGLFGFAGGGLVTGPGGPTSDTIPAMLSPGEVVMNAAAVKNLGASNLEAINKAMRAPTAASEMPRFAEGGMVGGGGMSGSLNMSLGLDHGLILNYLKSKTAGRVILQQLTNNPKAAQRALNRGA